MNNYRQLVPGICLIIFTMVHCGQPNHDTASFSQKIVDTIHSGESTIGISVINSRLNVPWEMLWGPDNFIWFTEQDGMVSRMNPTNGQIDTVMLIPDFYRKRLALASMVFHSDVKQHPFIFFNHLFLKDSVIYTRIVRYDYKKDDSVLLSNPLVLLEYPGHAGHNGSRLVISPDGKLMIATGDAFIEKNAQDTGSVSGKILRLNIDGTIPDDNPIPKNPFWSMGFRVPQGLVYSDAGDLYSAEHGDATDDEVNLITRGGNYGYPVVTGKCDSANELKYCADRNILEPLKAWTPTIAPAGIDYYNHQKIAAWKNALLLTTLKDQSLRVLQLNDDGKKVVDEKIILSKRLGRLRDVCVSPAGDIYISTSNRDWNPAEGFPIEEDDRIIRLSAMDDEALKTFKRDTTLLPDVQLTAIPDDLAAGQKIYSTYCESCHKADGNGVQGSFPPLRDASILYGRKKELIRMVLQGSASRKGVEGKYDQQMPPFAFLSDENIAEVLHYVRKKFGNSGERVRLEEVRGERGSEKR